MRCHFNDRSDEMSPPAYNIWTSGNLQTPHILKSILAPTATTADCYTNEIPTFNAIDSGSSSQKRKILDSEKEDFEERFHKIQRKKQLQKVVARANLVVADTDDDSDEEDKIYEQMDWIERENAMNVPSCDAPDDEFHFTENVNSPFLFFHRSMFKDERRRLLRISMAKIRGTEDPEIYLRRSVLINNTVRRLQSDVSVNYRCSSYPSTSFLPDNITYQNDGMNGWEGSAFHKNLIQPNSYEYQYASSSCNNDSYFSYGLSENGGNAPCSQNFNLACVPVSSGNDLHSQHCGEIHNNTQQQHENMHNGFHPLQHEELHELCTQQHNGLHNGIHNQHSEDFQNSASFCNGNSLDEQRMNDTSVSSSTLKQSCPSRMLSSQPCGLQYRNPAQNENPKDEYKEPSASGSSLLNRGVFQGLVTSLETDVT
ncbi:unnamed protein product [Larinioides sclopetarius]|uniref:SERTA domain-containing protein n=2 Tax=Larinioides sclopetarius TaxID=280406 RepID=A0AAV1Z103_9ARAC